MHTECFSAVYVLTSRCLFIKNTDTHRTLPYKFYEALSGLKKKQTNKQKKKKKKKKKSLYFAFNEKNALCCYAFFVTCQVNTRYTYTVCSIY